MFEHTEMKKASHIKLRKLSVIFFLSGYIFFLGAFSAHALILDGGITVPPNTSASDLADIDTLRLQAGTPAVKDFFSLGTPEKTLPLMRQVGVPNTSAVIRETGGGTFGQVVSQSNTSDLGAFINQAGGTTAGGLIKQVGVQNTNILLNQAGGRVVGELLKTAGLSNIVSVVNRTSSGTFSGVLGQVGAPIMSQVLNAAGGGSVGTAIGRLGGNTGDLRRIAGAGNEGGFLLSLANGSLGQAVGRGSGGTFGTFVSSVGPSSAAREIANGIADSGKLIPGTSGIISSPEVIAGELIDVLGLSDESGATNGTSGFCNTGTASGSVSGGVSGVVTGGVSGALGSITGGVASIAGDLVGGVLGGAGGVSVPVSDTEQQDLQRSILKDTNGVLSDTNAIRKLLKDLCEKEFVLDPKAQHEWIQVSENLVRSTVEFVNKAYDKNPLYLTNPYQYFDRVKENVAESFYQDVVANVDIDPQIKTLVLQEIKRYVHQKNWKTAIKQSIPNTKAQELSVDFEKAGGQDALQELLTNPQNNQDLVSLAITELERRLEETQSYEEQQLAWGQGFFSFRTCALPDFKSYQTIKDIRNCTIMTPGSLLKDHVSLVLGTALRQMEQADKYDERISQGAFTAISAVLGGMGLKNLTPESVTGGSIGSSEGNLSPKVEPLPRGFHLPPPFQPEGQTISPFQ